MEFGQLNNDMVLSKKEQRENLEVCKNLIDKLEKDCPYISQLQNATELHTEVIEFLKSVINKHVKVNVFSIIKEEIQKKLEEQDFVDNKESGKIQRDTSGFEIGYIPVFRCGNEN